MFLCSPLVVLLFRTASASPEIHTLSYTTLFRSLADGVGAGAVVGDQVGARAHRVGELVAQADAAQPGAGAGLGQHLGDRDRKSTRLNSSHPSISYAVFCLKKKNKNKTQVTSDKG